ncbi:DNA-binding MarR family transcriptional regulator [Agrobacterium tumefaciens]|uniref:DNA-binding MarR family transcriptional regulator n=1 Tax=Agrobacterium radiobacter TaxID=362 RepID=A0ABR6JCC6_AGRRD|nr:MarR family transcriptional regulator [Agrobacterium radiobacter]MBB4320493.1 DNA-binding MarR family transcriptional regulator [Agrobacterium radiobacter]MBB4337158.1 DNA-binding MarR family transcriptional regulator [Agrobacterium radiobacter]MBB4492594.1 DNA-binding MarR family transcriptional regulator [Agrobacterium radiobacter]MBB4497492.1 DNA-binding MarR family transcriptional regulator [Agrobacterium radiobacter]MBB4502597.1 DNA-binding MarR family transcriptional regulator [Agroba
MSEPINCFDRAATAAAEWRRERPDIDPFPMEVLGRLGEIAQIIMRDHLTPFFAKYGLQSGEFDVLATLRRSGAPYELTPTQLYEAAMLSSGGMTARIDRLERDGLVGRRSHPIDRRGTLVALTSKGVLLIDQILAEHVDNERSALAGLEPPEQQQLNALSIKLLAGLRSLPKP